MAKIWRGGMIGAGAWSEAQLAAWAGVTRASIVALCDRHPERRDSLLRRFGIPLGFDDVDTMLDEAELDFVDICTRPYSHASLTRLAAGRKLPVLCQKPFCESLEEAGEVVDYCERAGVRLMINENWRWQPWHRKMKELLDAGGLGEPFVASVHRRSRVSLPGFHHPQGYMKDMPRWAVYELGVHYLDTFRFLFGEPESIFARLHRVSPDVLGEDVEILVLGYPGLTCLVQQSFASVPVPGLDLPLAASDPQRMAHRFQVDGTRGTLVLSPDNSLRLFTDTQRQEWQFSPDGNAQSRTTAQQHFIDCLESGAEFETSGAETLKTMRLVYVAYRSAVEGSNIHLR